MKQDQDKYKLEPVKDPRGRKIRNLYRRNGVYYVQATVQGKRYLRSCPRRNLRDARRWVQQFIATAKENRTDDLEASRVRRPYPTVGRFIEVYREAAKQQFAIAGTPLPRTVNNNITLFRSIIGTVTGSKHVNELNLAVVSGELAQKYLQMKVLTTEPVDYQMQHRARLSAASVLRQAKSLFAKWALRFYDGRVVLQRFSF